MEPSLSTTSLLVVSALTWLFLIYLIRMIYKRYKARKNEQEYAGYKSKKTYNHFMESCKPDSIIGKHW